MQRVSRLGQQLAASAGDSLPVPLTEVPTVGVKMTPDVRFLLDETRTELADLYQPQTRPSGSLGAGIVFIHGGGWVGGRGVGAATGRWVGGRGILGSR